MAVVAGQEGESLPRRGVERPGIEARQLSLAPPATGQPRLSIAGPCRGGDPGGDLGTVGSVVERDRTPGPRQSDEMDVEVVKSRNDRGFAGVDDPRSAGGGIA